MDDVITKGIAIIPLEITSNSKYLDELVKLDEICLENYGRWSRENFLLDLPQKWLLSKLALSNGKLVGYIICSVYNGKGHIHRLAVHPSYQQLGIGRKLLNEILIKCTKIGITNITVEAHGANTSANNFYQEAGFRRLTGYELRDYLSEKERVTDLLAYDSCHATQIVYTINAKIGTGN